MKQCFSGHGRQQIVMALVIGALLLLLHAMPVAAQSETPSGAPLGGQTGIQKVETLLLPLVATSVDAPSAEPLSAPQAAASVVAEVHYYHQDISGNLLAMTDAAGHVEWRANSRPFGQGSPTSDAYPLRFVGQSLEAETGELGGLYQLGARYYDPVTGRFMSADPLSISRVPIGDSQAFNRYAYALNNPYRYEDPTGLTPDEILVGTELGRTYGALKKIANDSNYRPDVRKGAMSLIEKMEKAYELTGRAAESVSRAKVARAMEDIAEAKGVVALEGVSRSALIDTLANIGKDLRVTASGKLKGLAKGGGTLLTIIAVAITLPSIVEAAEQEKYGTVGADIINFINPWPMPTPPSVTVYDPNKKEFVEMGGGITEQLGRTVDDIIRFAKED